MIALTVDIEDWYHIPSVTGSPFAKYEDVDEFFRRWKERYDYLTNPTKRVLDLLDEHDLKATFFVVADVTEHYPGLVEQISSRGHEIACHGLHHACKIHPGTKQPLLSQAEFEQRTYSARAMLEKASGQKITGYRAPSAYIAGWMIDSLRKLGFKYDSSVSVNSFYNKSDGALEKINTQPYFPAIGTLEPDSVDNGITEIPWPYYKFIARFPTAGGPVLRILGNRYIGLGLKQSLKRGHTVFYFHPIDISEEKFPGTFSIKRPFYWLAKGGIVEKRLKKILSNYNGEIGMCKQILQKET